jgi:hypothetical protein
MELRSIGAASGDSATRRHGHELYHFGPDDIDALVAHATFCDDFLRQGPLLCRPFEQHGRGSFTIQMCMRRGNGDVVVRVLEFSRR